MSLARDLLNMFDETPRTSPAEPAQAPKRTDTKSNTSEPQNGAQKPADKPKPGKVYRLTGGPKSIANGNGWAESVVENPRELAPKTVVQEPQRRRCELCNEMCSSVRGDERIQGVACEGCRAGLDQAQARLDATPAEKRDELAPKTDEPTEWQRLMEHKPDAGFRFKHGISRTGAPYAFWSSRNESEDLSPAAREAWKDCQGPAVRDVINRAWRQRSAARGRLSFAVVQELKDAYADAQTEDREARKAQRQRAEAAEAQSRPRRGATQFAGDENPVREALHALELCYREFRKAQDERTAARLQKAMTAVLQTREGV